MEISVGLKDALLILSHFPSPSFALNTYSIHEILIDVSKGDKSILKTQAAVETVLPIVLQEYSRILNVSPAALKQHYGAFYDPDSGRMNTNIRKALKSEILTYILSAKVSKLLMSNSELLTWEFLRNTTKRYPKDPFTECAIRPIPELYKDSGILLSKEAALAFALEHGIRSEIATVELSNVFALTGLKDCTTLTYSTFIVYAIRCYVGAIIGDSDGDLKSKMRGTLNERVIESSVRKMLHHFSERLTSLQQSIRIRILGPLLQINKNARKRAILSECSYESLLRKALSFYTTRALSKDLSALFPFPPRPPGMLIDAPRAVALFSYYGIGEVVGSLLKLWAACGPRSTDNVRKDRFLVLPTPSQLTEDNEVLFDLLKGICSASSSREEASVFSWEENVLHTVFPLIVSRGDHALDFRGGAVESKYDYYLEDILRYGGSNCMEALHELDDWLHYIYKILSNAGEDSELLMNPACRFVSCYGLIRMGVVAVQAKGAMHARIRPIPATRGSVTLSFPEFEDLFLRSAFALWSEMGKGASLIDSPEVETSFLQSNRIQGMQTVAASIYRQECGINKGIQNNPSSDGHHNSRWGVNFLTPFSTAIRNVGVHLLKNGDVSELSAYFGLDREILENIFMTSPQASLPGHSTENPIVRSYSPKNVVSEPTVLVPAVASDAIDLLSQKDVQSRSGELLEDILKSRSSAPLTPERRQILKTIIEGNGSSEDKSPAFSPVTHRDNSQRVKGFVNHVYSGTSINERAITPPDSPDTAQAKVQRQALIPSPTRLLLDGTKEALWPVYGTYCSCGDSIDPGKLSGPNLFALLSKLGVLTDTTVMSDIGILLHQISAHTHSSSVSIAATSSSEAFESPSLSFEEFLVFLCAFAQLRFDGIISAPILNSGEISQELSSAGSQNTDIWLQNWKTFMGSSSAFRRLMEESVLPMLKKYPLLAFPEDARHRDRYSAVFSLEVLLAVESSEILLREVFDEGQEQDGVSVTAILEALKNVELVPNVVNEGEVIQLIRDVIPEGQKQHMSRGVSSPRGAHMRKQKMIFPQWEWVICIVSFQAVEKDILQNGEDPAMDIKNIPSRVADVITFIATAATR